MLRAIFVTTCLSALCLGQPSLRSEPAPGPGVPFTPSTPAALRTFWLDFHANRLCQDIDAVFVFHADGLEVWCLTDNQKSLDRLKRMAAPLSPPYRVEFYVTRPQAERDKGEEGGPPPGLWNNQELRSFLGDIIEEHRHSAPTSLSGVDDAMFTLTNRIQMFADQMLQLSQRLESYAMDLEGLSAVAFDPAYAAADRTRARTLCALHASAIDECASKLDQNLRQALPPPAKSVKSERRGDEMHSAASPRDTAAEIARQGHKMAHRVYRFIYPDHFTVGIADLREPGLLESLAALRRLAADFQHKLKKG